MGTVNLMWTLNEASGGVTDVYLTAKLCGLCAGGVTLLYLSQQSYADIELCGH